MPITLAVAIILLLAGIAGCSREDAKKPADAKGVAEVQGRLATTPEQARLWEKAAGTEAVRGLETLPVVEQPVTPRPRITVTDRRAPSVAAGSVAGATGVRILSAPGLNEGSFMGAAKVVRAEGDRLELDLGNQRILSLQASVGGASLRAAPGGFARVDLRKGNNPNARREILAVRLPSNDGILSVLETGSKPVAVKVPLFELAARQVGEANAGTMQVEVRVGTESKILSHGQTAEFPTSRLAVEVVSSSAYTGALAGRAEGMPFAIRLKAWATR